MQSSSSGSKRKVVLFHRMGSRLFDRIQPSSKKKSSHYYDALYHQDDDDGGDDEKKIDLSGTTLSSDNDDADGRERYDDEDDIDTRRTVDAVVVAAADANATNDISSSDSGPDGHDDDDDSHGHHHHFDIEDEDDDEEEVEDEQGVAALSHSLANHRYDLRPMMDMGMLEVQQQQEEEQQQTQDQEQKQLEYTTKTTKTSSDVVVFPEVEPIQPELTPCPNNNSFTTSNPSFTTVNVMSRSSSFSSIGFVQDESPARGRMKMTMIRQSQSQSQSQQQLCYSTPTRNNQPRCSSSLPPLPPKKATTGNNNNNNTPLPLLTDNQISNILSKEEPTNKGLRLFLKLTQKLSTTSSTDDIEDEKDDKSHDDVPLSPSPSSGGGGGGDGGDVKVEARDHHSTVSNGRDGHQNHQQGASTEEVMSSLAAFEELHRSSSTSTKSTSSSKKGKLVVQSKITISNNETSSNITRESKINTTAPTKVEIDEARAALIKAGRSAILGTANSSPSTTTTVSSEMEESVKEVDSDEDTFVPGPKKTCEQLPNTNKQEVAVPEKEMDSPFKKISNRLERVDTKKVSAVVKSSAAMRGNTVNNTKNDFLLCGEHKTATTTTTTTVISVSTIDATIAETPDSPQLDGEDDISGLKGAIPGYSSNVDAFLEFNKRDSVKDKEQPQQPHTSFPRDIIEFRISPEENVVISCEGPPSTDELCNNKIYEDNTKYLFGNATKQYFDRCLGRQVDNEVAEISTDKGNIGKVEASVPSDDDTTSSNHGSSMVGDSNVVGWNLGAWIGQPKDNTTVPKGAVLGHQTSPTEEEDTASPKLTFPTVDCSNFLDSISGAATVFRKSETPDVDTDVVSSERAKTSEKVYSDRIDVPNPEEPTKSESIFAESRRAFKKACCMIDEMLVTDDRSVDEMAYNVVEDAPDGEKKQDSHSCDKMFCGSSIKEMWCNYAYGETAEMDGREPEPQPEPELEFEPEPVADIRVSEDVQDHEENEYDDDFNDFCEFDDESVFGISMFSALDISVISAGTGDSGEYKTNTPSRIRSCDQSQRSLGTKKSTGTTSVVHRSFERPPSSCSKNIADAIISPTDKSCDQSESPNYNKISDSLASF